MKPALEAWIATHRKTMVDPAGREIAILDDFSAGRAADETGCALGTVYRTALAQDVWPLRYIRNHDSLTAAEQYRLATARVAVIGAGGLGGTVILQLARIGIGGLTVVDSDVFDETNFNRQAVSKTASLGKSKAEEAAARVRQVNAAVEVRTFAVPFRTENAAAILDRSDVAVDALDNVPDRLLLGKEARKRGIVLVHGAIAGFEGRVMTIFPEDPGLEALYDGEAPRNDPQRPEAVLGVPTVTPAVIGDLQTMEVIKVLLKRGRPLRHTLLHVDLQSSRFEAFRL